MIAPNNELPAECFIEVFNPYRKKVSQSDIRAIERLEYALQESKDFNCKTIALFKIRLNKLPTKHKFI